MYREKILIIKLGMIELLEGNSLIHRLLHYDLTTVLQLQAETFDTVVNLEKVPGMRSYCDLSVSCMNFIRPETVASAVFKLFGGV